ncbi:TPA: DUF1738 domain-containing protein [Klebsiella aerogenes]|nr:DUF1738 domain-containing protein [Klebsiella aerogenes]
MFKTKLSKNLAHSYQSVIENSIESLEFSVKPWSSPWQRATDMSALPSNSTNGVAYIE